MKKFLLSLAAMATVASMSATSYTLFDIANAGEWAGDGDGWGQIVSFGDKKVTITSNKAESSTPLVAPNSNTYAWRIYKSSSVKFAAQGINMKKMVLTYDDYNNGQYCVELTLSNGWTGALNEATYTLTSAGLAELEVVSSNGQARVKTIVVSDTDEVSDPQTPTAQQAYNPKSGDTPDPGTDPTPDGVIYQNAFDSNLDGWVKINDEALSDYSGWKINTSQKCVVANSFYKDPGADVSTNHAANAKLQKEFDLTQYTDVNLSFEQAFGFDFPTTQTDNYRVYVIAGGATEYLTMANFPDAPAQGKNWTSFVENTFDLSEYDGVSSLTIGFEYANEGGSKSRAWELKNFVLNGTKSVGVDNIAAEENVAPAYYNLQGVRVAAPESGLYIVVKGNKATKVVF